MLRLLFEAVRRPAALAALAWLLCALDAGAQDLATWTDGAARRAIIGFVTAVSTPGADFVPPDQRIAVFDNDGTLWTEQPVYAELAFSLARAAEMAKADPKLAAQPAFQAAASGEAKRSAALSQDELLQLMSATHAGMTTEAFSAAARAWMAEARDPRWRRPYDADVYAPMLDLLAYLRGHGFKTFIVSGGDADFLRTFAGPVYGIAPDQVIGSSSGTRLEQRDGRWVLVRTPQMTIDDGPAKPSNIALHIGRRPIFAAGNSDGDLQMLQYAASGPGRRMALLIHHDDAAREYAYDRGARVGALDKALDAAARQGWTVVSMKADWRTIFPAAAALATADAPRCESAPPTGGFTRCPTPRPPPRMPAHSEGAPDHAER